VGKIAGLMMAASRLAGHPLPAGQNSTSNRSFARRRNEVLFRRFYCLMKLQNERAARLWFILHF
jgi:hypothetical protein